jgi:hypothetical protein
VPVLPGRALVTRALPATAAHRHSHASATSAACAGPTPAFFRHITCAATGGPNSGVKTGPTPITGTSGLVNGTASIAISAATALVTLLFALNNFLGGLSF